MLDPLGDESHSVPDHEDARRDRDLPAHVDQDPVAAREERLHRVPGDSDHPQILWPGLEFMPNEGIGEKPRRLGLLHLFVPGPRARRRADVDLGHRAVAHEISLNGDVYASIQSETPGRDNFIPREFELSFVSALDPFTRAKVFLAAEEDGGRIEVFPDGGEEGEGGGVTVEEGYVEWVALPGGVGLKVGRFFQQFGQLNRWHSHALQFQSRSLPHLAFIGEESLAQDGASVHWLLPTGGSGAYEATVEVTRGRNEILFGESHGLSYLGHMNAFWELSASTDLDLGVSALFGDYEDLAGRYGNRLFGAEMSFNWAPPERSLYRGLVARGGVMLSDPGAVPGLTEPEAVLGVWSLVEVKLSQQWIAGGRYEWVENPEDPTESAWLVSPALTYWQSEYVRLRAEYDVLGNPGSTTGQFTLRITFAMGPHKHETY